MTFTASTTTRIGVATAGLAVILSPVPAFADDATAVPPADATAPAQTARAEQPAPVQTPEPTAPVQTPAPATTPTSVPAGASTATPRKSTAQSTTRHTRATRAAGSTRADWQRHSVVKVALRHKGSRYVYGSAGPRQFDCSGFTMYVYRQATGKKLPHYSGAQMKRAQRVSVKHMKPGDLLFYGRGGSQHVSMYIGKGKMIHAANPRTGVRVDSIHTRYWKSRFAGAGRLIQR